MNAGLAMRQLRFEVRSFFRNRAAMAFTFLFPLMFLVIFGINSKGKTMSFEGTDIPFIQFFVPGIVAYGVIGACYTNLAMRIIHLRDNGILKRVRGTPLPPLSYMTGQIGASVYLGLLLAAVTVIAGIVGYGVHIDLSRVPAILIGIAIGAACFCSLGLAITTVVPNAEAAPAIINFSMFPFLFISDIFYSIDDAPRWLMVVANIFPIRHFANALQTAFDPTSNGLGFGGWHYLVLIAWTVVGTLVAARRFNWDAGKVG